jgi:proton-dependent oligopeptide transporter, POT family
MATGAAFGAAAFLLLAAVAASAGGGAASWLWLALFFLVITVGELFILPVGVALFARLAPPALVVTTVALWFLNNFAGNFLAGALGAFWGELSPAVFFVAMAAVSAASAGLLFALERPVQGVPSAARPAPGEREAAGQAAQGAEA